MSTLDAVILNEILALKKQGSSLPPVGFGVTMAEKGDVVEHGSAKFLRSGILAKLGSSSSFPASLAYTIPAGAATNMFGAYSFWSCACSNDTAVLTKNGGTKVYVARASTSFTLEELDFPGPAACRVRYENGIFFFFPPGATSVVYYSSDDMATIRSVGSAVSAPKAVRFLSDTSLVFLQHGSSLEAVVSSHTLVDGVLYPGSSLTLSGVTWLSDLAYVITPGGNYFIAFRGGYGPAKATQLTGPYAAIITDPASVGGVTVNSAGAAITSTAVQFSGKCFLVRNGVCYFILPGAGVVSLDPITNKVALVIPYAGTTGEAKLHDLSAHFALTLNAADSFRFYSPEMRSLPYASLTIAGNLESALSERIAIRFPATTAGVPIATVDYLKYVGMSDYTKNLYLRIE